MPTHQVAKISRIEKEGGSRIWSLSRILFFAGPISLFKLSAEMAGRHGGNRPGAGRKPGPVIEPEPIITLIELLNRLPRGAIGRQRRCAMALAGYGAADLEIAAALAIEPAEMAEFLGADIETGRIALRANLRHEIMRAGLGKGRPFSLAAAKTALQWLAPPEAGR